MLQSLNAVVHKCPVCDGRSRPHDVVDFNRSCEESRGKYLPLSGEPIYYARCQDCGFCFAPEMLRWPLETFARKVYNEGYAEIDPDYLTARPKANADVMLQLFPDFAPKGRHLDYGGGNGAVSNQLAQAGWNTVSYDPFANPDIDPMNLGSFDLITAFEVFEHVPDIAAILATLSDVLRTRGMLMFTTLLSDGAILTNQRLTWWYAAPRNGHISLFTRQSLTLLAEIYGFRFTSLSANTHLFVRDQPPAWADHPITRQMLAS